MWLDELFYYYLGYLIWNIVVLEVLYFVGRYLYINKVGPTLGLNTDFARVGKWAVITGCTDGIGKQYADQLAAKKQNVFLISRSQSKLDKLATELESKHHIRTKTLAIDFSEESEIYERIKESLEDVEVGTLVNNVGVSNEPQWFHKFAEHDVKRMINVNIMSLVMMTKIVLPQMVERGRGVVINLSSIAAAAPSPLFSVYSASKIFVDYFNSALKIEYHKKGIIFQSILPGPVDTAMYRQAVGHDETAKEQLGALKIGAPEYVRDALNTVGLTNRTSVFWKHSLFCHISHCVYETLHTWLYTRIVIKMTEDFHTRFHAAAARKM